MFKYLVRFLAPVLLLILISSIAIATPAADDSTQRAVNEKLASADLSAFNEASPYVAQRIRALELNWARSHPGVAAQPAPTLAAAPACGAYSLGAFCPAAKIGNGWRETYWNNTDLVGMPVVDRIAAPPFYYWGDGSPSPLVNVDNFSGRYEGTFEPPTDDYYKFQYRATSKVRMYIDGVLVCNSWTYTTLVHACNVGYRVMEGGRKYRIVAEFAHYTGTDARSEFLINEVSFGTTLQTLPLNQSYNITQGVYQDGAPWDPTKIDGYKTLVGGRSALLSWYQTWADTGLKEFDTVKMNDTVNRGMTPMIHWNPGSYQAVDHVNQPAYNLAAIIRGDHDVYITQFAAASAAWGKPMYLVPMGAMNGDWHPWSATVNGNTPAQYVQAWKHIRDIFTLQGATNVKFVWAPYRVFNGSTSLASLYPGDAYVDWTGMSGYNYGGTSWISFKDLFQEAYNQIVTLAPAKPLLINEVASAEDGGSKSTWINSAFGVDAAGGVEHNMPRVRAVVWFNSPSGTNTQWPATSSTTALDAYKTSFAQSSAYQGMLTGAYNTP